MSDYIVEPKSRKDLRIIASFLRTKLGLDNQLYFPIVELLDAFSLILKGFNYEIVEDDELPGGVHADTDIRTGHVRISETVYERACDGEGRDRMTIAHELAHYLTLCLCGFTVQRNFEHKKYPAYMDPEWQAKCLAGELMMSYDLIKGMNPIEIANSCGVSLDAASYQYSKNNE